MKVLTPIAGCALLAALAAPSALAAQEAAQEAVPPAQQETEAAPATLTDDRVINMILVKVNGTPIFLSELETELATQLAALEAQFPEEQIRAQLATLRRDLLAAKIDQRMMEQRADQLQITADANAVDRAIQNLRAESGLESQEEFEAALASNGLTMDELRATLRTQIRQQQLAYQEVQRGIVTTDSEIARYYEENQQEFVAPEQLRLEQVVFVGGSGLREQALEALGQLRSGADLQQVASAYDTASAFPADDTFVRLDDLNESLATAVPELPEGQFSEPIQSQFGWHLVRVVERQPRTVQALDEVRETIRNRLRIEKSNRRMNAYMGQLREQTFIEILADEFRDIESYWREAEGDAAPTGAR